MRYVLREMMFGFQDEFDYFECGNCGCIQIGELPDDLSKYYPHDYYSFRPPKVNLLKQFLKEQRVRYAVDGNNVLGKLLTRWFGYPQIVSWVQEWRDYAGVSFEDSLLDVGCGTGQYLLELRRMGFRLVAGVDPHIRNDISYGDGVKVRKQEIAEVGGQYDFVILLHSFEHMPDPRSTLKEIYRIVSPGKFVCIRIPVAGSYAWRTYSVDWVQLDPPRHLHLHTRRSIELLAGEAGFRLEHVVYNSDEFQFWGSEQYRRGIPLYRPNSYRIEPDKSLFTSGEIRRFREEAAELNKKGEGDTASFYLFKPR